MSVSEIDKNSKDELVECLKLLSELTKTVEDFPIRILLNQKYHSLFNIKTKLVDASISLQQAKDILKET